MPDYQSVVYPNWPVPKYVKAFTTTRQQGNFAMHTGDNLARVQRNRQQLIEDYQLPSAPCWLQQTHGTNVINLDSKSPQLMTGDAAFSKQPQKICAVMTADCLPLLLYSPTSDHVAAIHGGWRGLAAGIINHSIATMVTKPHHLLAWLGPAIGPEKFEVGEDVLHAFLKLDRYHEEFFKQVDGRWLANIYSIARHELTKLGVSEIYGGSYCTMLQDNLFYSYRHDGDKTGRMVSLIYLDRK